MLVDGVISAADQQQDTNSHDLVANIWSYIDALVQLDVVFENGSLIDEILEASVTRMELLFTTLPHEVEEHISVHLFHFLNVVVAATFT